MNAEAENVPVRVAGSSKYPSDNFALRWKQVLCYTCTHFVTNSYQVDASPEVGGNLLGDQSVRLMPAIGRHVDRKGTYTEVQRMANNQHTVTISRWGFETAIMDADDTLPLSPVNRGRVMISDFVARQLPCQAVIVVFRPIDGFLRGVIVGEPDPTDSWSIETAVVSGDFVEEWQSGSIGTTEAHVEPKPRLQRRR
jgi:hypothetical protein